MSTRNNRQGGSLFQIAGAPAGKAAREIRRGGSLFQIAGAPGGRQRRRISSRDLEYSGDGRLTVPDFDAVLKDGLAGAFRIRVLDERSGILVREVWSDAAGQWEISHIRTDIAFTVICFDHALKYDPIAFSSVFAEKMP